MSKQHQLTPTPPLGWNSYDCLASFANEELLMENLEVFIEKLLPFGYNHFVIDIGWYREFKWEGETFPKDINDYTSKFDEFGRMVPHPHNFPNGFKKLVDKCHQHGIRFGLHLMRGIPKLAIEANVEIKGTPYRAKDIANLDDTCSWCPDNVGVNMDHPGGQAYYDSIVELLAEWGVDFIKYDDIVPAPREVDAVIKAIESSGRDIVLSLSPGNNHKEDGWDSYKKANMIRVSGDIWDKREDFRWAFDRWQAFQDISDSLPKGCWLDLDMIPFGELQVWNDPENAHDQNILMNGKGTRRMCKLNSAQKRTFLTMRAISASPLMMGGFLPSTDQESFAMLTNEHILECNQNGVIGKLQSYTDWTCTWRCEHAKQANEGWIGVFNRSPDAVQKCRLTPETLGIPSGSRLLELWTGSPLGTCQEALEKDLAPDDVLFIRYAPAI